LLEFSWIRRFGAYRLNHNWPGNHFGHPFASRTDPSSYSRHHSLVFYRQLVVGGGSISAHSGVINSQKIVKNVFCFSKSAEKSGL
jgi:hypothetical protein